MAVTITLTLDLGSKPTVSDLRDFVNQLTDQAGADPLTVRVSPEYGRYDHVTGHRVELSVTTTWEG